MSMDGDFAGLLNPVSRDEFLHDYWEQKPLHIQRDESGYFASLLSSNTFDKAIYFGRPTPPEIIVTKNQTEALPSSYIARDGKPVMNQIYKKFDEGHTVILNGIDAFWEPLAKLTDSLTRELSHKVVPNAYYSPANSVALKPHYDTHDVFVLQAEGKKVWNLYPSIVKTPLVGSFQPVFDKKQLGRPRMTVELSAGDTLYVPRGVIHDAETGTDSSLHMTIGVYPTQWLDFIDNILRDVAQGYEPLRKALPAGYLNSAEMSTDLESMFREIVQDVATKVNVQQSAEHMRVNALSETTVLPDGHFGQLTRLSTVNLQSVVERKAGVSCRVFCSDDAVRLQVPGNIIKGALAYLGAFQFIAEVNRPFSPAELPDNLSDEYKVSLTTRLIRSGLLKLQYGV